MPNLIKKTLVFLIALLLSSYCYAEDPHLDGNLPLPLSDAPLTDDLLAMPLEQLMALSITTSVNKKQQSVKNSAAAIFVISQDDIRRSGATNIPEALRMAPGLQVAQIDANKWAISSRGFNDRFVSKMLVMIDGRTVYTPVTSGLYWHRDDTPLEDVDRIEVIRGAGAAMWGANAMNGVINIVTKSAKNTQGTLLTAGGGNQEQGFGSGRYGGKLGDNFYYRAYGKGFKRNNNKFVGNQDAQDDWESYQGGFKTEWELNKQDSISTQGDMYRSRTGDKENFALPYPPFVLTGQDSPAEHIGGNIQTRWKHKISDVSETALQVYFKQDDSDWNFVTPYHQHEQTADVDFQYRFNFLEQHDIIWGAGYRYFDFSSTRTVKFGFDPANRNLQLFSTFLQDDIALLKNELILTLGSRLEHNDFTGFEVQPNIRLMWTPDDKQSVWGAISRAVRTPSLVGHNLNNFRNIVPPDPSIPLPAITTLDGNPNLKSETVLDYELGYRIQPTKHFSIDVTAFYNDYDRLQAFEILPANVVLTTMPPHIEIPVQYTNKMRGETLGAELTTQWQPTDWLKMQASYWALKANLHTPRGVNFFDGDLLEKNSPQQQFHFKTSLNLPSNIELDTMLRYVDSIPRFPVSSYVAFDMRLAWKPIRNLELAVIGQNLFDNQHAEFKEIIFELPQTEIQRSIFGNVSLSF